MRCLKLPVSITLPVSATASTTVLRLARLLRCLLLVPSSSAALLVLVPTRPICLVTVASPRMVLLPLLLVVVRWLGALLVTAISMELLTFLGVLALKVVVLLRIISLIVGARSSSSRFFRHILIVPLVRQLLMVLVCF